MYKDFYRLTGFPFQLTPDHRFFFESRPHRKALAYLSYGLSKGEGFIVITGEIGAGKSTLIGYLLASLADKEFAAAKIVTTQVEADDLLRLAVSAFGLPSEGADKATLLQRMEAFLVRARRLRRRACLIVDEAQSLTNSSIEELRMLSNFQQDDKPLLQVILLGQVEFRKIIVTKQFEQLRQRIVASYHLGSLDAEETRRYIEHRLRCVGWQSDPSFTDPAFDKIFEETAGVPRKINQLCDRLLLYGYLEEKHQLDQSDVTDVVIDMHEDLLASIVTEDPDTTMRPLMTRQGRSRPSAEKQGS